MIISILISACVASTTSLNAKLPTRIFGICNKIGTFQIPEELSNRDVENLHSQYFAKIHLRPDTGKVVVKFRSNIIDMCKNLNQVMGNVQRSLLKMLFKKEKFQVVKKSATVLALQPQA